MTNACEARERKNEWTRGRLGNLGMKEVGPKGRCGTWDGGHTLSPSSSIQYHYQRCPICSSPSQLMTCDGSTATTSTNFPCWPVTTWMQPTSANAQYKCLMIEEGGGGGGGWLSTLLLQQRKRLFKPLPTGFTNSIVQFVNKMFTGAVWSKIHRQQFTLRGDMVPLYIMSGGDTVILCLRLRRHCKNTSKN